MLDHHGRHLDVFAVGGQTEIGSVGDEQRGQLDSRALSSIKAVNQDLLPFLYTVLLTADLDDGEHPDSSIILNRQHTAAHRRPRATQYSKVDARLPPSSLHKRRARPAAAAVGQSGTTAT